MNINIFGMTKKGEYEYKYEYLDWYTGIQIQIHTLVTHWFNSFFFGKVNIPFLVPLCISYTCKYNNICPNCIITIITPWIKDKCDTSESVSTILSPSSRQDD